MAVPAIWNTADRHAHKVRPPLPLLREFWRNRKWQWPDDPATWYRQRLWNERACRIFPGTFAISLVVATTVATAFSVPP